MSGHDDQGTGKSCSKEVVLLRMYNSIRRMNQKNAKVRQAFPRYAYKTGTRKSRAHALSIFVKRDWEVVFSEVRFAILTRVWLFIVHSFLFAVVKSLGCSAVGKETTSCKTKRVI
jgi:hypothetical protein